MKHTLFIIFIAFLGMSFQKSETTQSVRLSGQIKNGANLTLKINALTNTYSKTISLDDLGNFKDDLNLSEGHYMLYDSQNITYIYVENSKVINLSYDIEAYNKTLHFEGDNTSINSYLAQKRIEENKLSGEKIDPYSLNKNDYYQRQRAIQIGLQNFLINYPNLPKSYIEKEKRNIEYTFIYKSIDYENYRANKVNQSQGLDSINFKFNIDYNREDDYKFSYPYYRLVYLHYKNEAKILSKLTSIPEDVAMLQVLQKASNPYIKNSILYSEAKLGIHFTSDIEAYYNAFTNSSTNSEQIAEITKSYNELRTVSKGTLSPKFTNYEMYSGGTTSLDDLKGKYVYIDIWATWCGPCKYELPFLKKIEEQYHNKNISFVSISVDRLKDREKWKAMIAKDDLKGIQLLADRDFESEFIKSYFIKGIPKFILIDPDGKIVSPNAPRPSNEELSKLLDSLNL